MGSTTNHYDLIVIGSDISGLVAASLVAKRGKRVLVIPHGSPDATYKLGRRSFALDTAPLMHLRCPAVRHVYEELGLWTQLKRERRLIDGLLHWVLPGHRLDVEPAMKNWGDETHREWPEDPVDEAWGLRDRWTSAVDELLDELLASEGALVADGFWARRFLSRVSEQLPKDSLDELSPLPEDHALRGGARAVEAWLTHLSPRQLGKAASLRVAGLWAAGPEDREGGDAGLRRQLMGRITLKSGEIKPDLRVAEVLLKRGKATGISLLGKKDRYGCDHLLLATNPHNILGGPEGSAAGSGPGILMSDQLPKPLGSTLASIGVAAQRFVMHLEIAERGLGPAFEGTAICVPKPDPDGYSFVSDHGAGLMYARLEGTHRQRPGGAWGSPAGVRQIAITRIIAPESPLADMREQILEELEVRGVLPFAREHLSLVHSPHDGREATDGRGKAVEGYGSETAMRLPMAAISQCSKTPILGVGLLPHSSGIKNLYLASRMTLPGLGLEGEFAAGMAAAGMIAAGGRSGIARPFLGRA